MRHIQDEPDHRQIPIDKVGVKDVRYPITVMDRGEGWQRTVATVNMYVDLPHHFRGTHMSRFIEVLTRHHGEVTLGRMGKILKDIRQALKAHAAHLEAEFPYFIQKRAPVSKSSALQGYTCLFVGTSNGTTEEDFILGVKVPVTTLCPCSRDLADRGAHNQRGLVTIKVRFSDFVWIEELVEVAEEAASSPVYALLKREDEKYVTEHAYDNPRFVEDVVREVVRRLEAMPRVTWYTVEVENLESIHDHSAYAAVEKKRSPEYGGDETRNQGNS